MVKRKPNGFILTFLLIVLLLVAFALAVGWGMASASDVSNALFSGTITVSNNGTATGNVSATVSINSTSMINQALANSTLEDTAIRYQGSDVAFMPGYEDNPWAFWVSAIASSQSLSDILYSKGVTGGDTRYFPGPDGMKTADSAALEPGDNFTFEWGGWLDTTASGDVIDSFTDDADGAGDSLGAEWNAQTFTTTSSYTIGRVSLPLRRTGTPGLVEVSITPTSGSDPTSENLTTGTTDGNTLPTASTEWRSISFNSTAPLSDATLYAIVVRAPGGDGGNFVRWYGDDGEGYANGTREHSNDFGATWANQNDDKAFRTYEGTTRILSKTGAIDISSVSGNVTAMLNSTGDNVTATGVSSGERVVTTSANVTHYWIEIDGSVEDITTLSANITDNANDYVCGSDATPYMEYLQVTIDGVLQQRIEWEYSDTFTDLSGNGHDATPTFRTTSSDADVTATLTNLHPISPAQTTNSYSATDYTVITGNATAPGQLYTDLQFTNVPGAEAVNVLLEESDTPQALWWFPFLFIGIGIMGFMIYEPSRSELGMAIVMDCGLWLFGIMNPLMMWPAILFWIPAGAIILSKRHVGWG